MSYNYGKSITRNFYPLEDDEPIELPSQAPAIYLYSSLPTLADAQAGTGAIASHSISYWEPQAVTPYARSWTFPPIANPSPNSATSPRGYWEVINFVSAPGGQRQTVINQLVLERTQALPEIPGTTKADLKRVWPGISTYITDSQLDDFLQLAMEEMQSDFQAKGFDWGTIKNLSRARLALAFKTIELANLSQFKEENDRFHLRFKEFQNKYNNAIATSGIESDTDGDGAADVPAEIASRTIRMVR